MVDHSMMKLGKKEVKIDKRTLRLAPYLQNVPFPPASASYTLDKTDWGMFVNDQLGDCTIAGVGHADQVWGINLGRVMPMFTDAEIIKYYKDWDGYVIGDPSTDNGGVELDVLNSWRKNGFYTNKLLAYGSVSPVNTLRLQQSIWLFGVLYIGVELPITAQTQDIWDIVQVSDGSATLGSWGGHCVVICAYDGDGPTCITWGKLKKMTWRFFEKYCSEAYALLSPDWINANPAALFALSPSGFNMTQLQKDLAQVIV